MKKFLVALTLALVLALGCVVIASAAGPEAVNENAIVAYGDIGSITKIAGHDVVPAGSVEELHKYIPATCTEYGYAYFKCAEATHINGIHVVRIKMEPHKWEEEPIVAATCTTDGTAQLVCAVCGKEGDVVTVPATGHTLSKVAYYYEPTCTEAGYGYRICEVCGAADPNVKAAPKDKTEASKAGPYGTEFKLADGTTVKLNAKYWVEVAATKHIYTEWKISKDATCAEYGKATKTCIKCGDIIRVDDTSVDEHYDEKTGKIVKEGGLPLKDILPGVKKVNAGYKAAIGKIAATYDNYSELQAAVKEALKLGEIELLSDVYVDCNNRTVTYVCPYCGSTLGTDGKPCKITETEKAAHPAKVVKMTVETHVWKAKPEEAVQLKDNATKKDYTVQDYINAGATKGLADTMGDGKALREVYVNETHWANANQSVAPNCVLPGYNLYLCEYDDKGVAHGHDADTEYKVEYLYNTGHNWSDWTTVETYTLEGKNYKVQSHYCKTCGIDEHETIEYEVPEEPVLNGLVLVDDEFLYYVNDEWQDDFTGVVEYDGQKFYVVDGKDDCKTTGLTLIDNQFVYLIENRLATEVNQVVLYDGEWFKVVNGVLDTKMPAGLYDYDGGKFIFAAGRLINDYTGLWLNPLDNDWYYIKAGSGFDSSFTGETVYDGATFQVVNGKLAK
jgi:hypothetical protein